MEEDHLGEIELSEILVDGRRSGSCVIRTRFGLNLRIDPLERPHVILLSECCGKRLVSVGNGPPNKIFNTDYSCTECGKRFDRDGRPIAPIFNLFPRIDDKRSLISDWIFNEVNYLDLNPIEALLASANLVRRIEEMIVESRGSLYEQSSMQIPRFIDFSPYTNPLF